MPEPTAIAGVILAGGRSRRMGGADKSFALLAGRPLAAHVIKRLRPQVADLAINANGGPSRFAALGLPVIADTLPDYPGPLAGMLAGLRWAATRGFGRIATAPVDSPFLPGDLVERLAEAAKPDVIALARSGGRLHPVFGLFPVGLADDLERFIRRGESLRVTDWLATQAVKTADFPSEPPAFFNVNTPEDLAITEQILARHPVAATARLPESR
jgi:molybdopterin-guanine dinucleotide biosynthesis protein A